MSQDYEILKGETAFSYAKKTEFFVKPSSDLVIIKAPSKNEVTCVVNLICHDCTTKVNSEVTIRSDSRGSRDITCDHCGSMIELFWRGEKNTGTNIFYLMSSPQTASSSQPSVPTIGELSIDGHSGESTVTSGTQNREVVQALNKTAGKYKQIENLLGREIEIMWEFFSDGLATASVTVFKGGQPTAGDVKNYTWELKDNLVVLSQEGTVVRSFRFDAENNLLDFSSSDKLVRHGSGLGIKPKQKTPAVKSTRKKTHKTFNTIEENPSWIILHGEKLLYIIFFISLATSGVMLFEPSSDWWVIVFITSDISAVIVGSKYAHHVGRSAIGWGIGCFLFPYICPAILATIGKD